MPITRTHRSRAARRATIAGLGTGVALILAASPPAALAGTASVGSDGVPRFDAASNEANDLRVAELSNPGSGVKTIVFTDNRAITLGPGCTRINASMRVAGCNMSVTLNLVRADLGDENDRLSTDSFNPPATVRFSAEGETGNDTLLGTVNNDVLDGEGGEDRVEGFGGHDYLEGDSGDDMLLGGLGDDHLTGGGQADALHGGTGRDDLFGDSGDDSLNADDQAGGDFADCGENLFDIDVVRFNVGDTLVNNCEQQQFA